jgi:hypothetical protein
MKLDRNEKGFKFNDLKPFLFFVSHLRELSNQEIEELNLIYKLKSHLAKDNCDYKV